MVRFLPLQIALLCLLCAAPAPTAHAAASAVRHPQDGPDIDVRISINPDAVAINFIVNLAYLDEVAEPQREDPDFLHPVEYETLRRAMFEYLREDIRITIDGVDVSPIEREFEVLEPNMDLLPLFPMSGMRAILKAQMNLEYPVKSPPKSVAFEWGTFPVDPLLSSPGSEMTIEVTAQLTAAGVLSFISFTEEERGYTWHDTGETIEDRFLPVPAQPTSSASTIDWPVLSLTLLVCAGVMLIVASFARQKPRRRRAVFGVPILLVAAGLTRNVWVVEVHQTDSSAAALPSEADALAVFEPLHANIYRAFDYTTEDQIYDSLAQSVDGEMLDSLYNQIYRGLIMQEEGGAVSRVQAVDLREAEVESIGLMPPEDDPGFRVRARWRVLGTVYHWGHTHSRTNEYAAVYTVIDRGEGWRIAGSEVLEQARVDTITPPANTQRSNRPAGSDL